MGNRVMDVDYYPIDLSILAAHTILVVQAKGVGGCILDRTNDTVLHKELGIPSSRRVVLDILPNYSGQSIREERCKYPDEAIH